MKTLLIFIGVVISLAGLLTDGLWPWQLPACGLGGALIGFGLVLFKRDKTH